MADFQGELQRLSGKTLDAQACANAWAGTSGLELLAALNAKAGTSGLGLDAVCNRLAGTSGLSAQAALAAVVSGPPVTTGLVGRWDASVASSITSAAGRVTALADLSTSGFNVSNPGGVARPTTGAHTQNGLNVVEFDGAANYLQNASVSVAAGNTVTVFAVVTPNWTNGDERIISLDKNVNDYDGADIIAAILRNGAGVSGVSAYYNSSRRGTKDMTTAAHCVVSQRSGDSHVMRVDGSAGTTSTGLGTANFAITNVTLGAYLAGTQGFYTGYMGEVLWYNSALSAGNISLVEAYLKAKWGTP